MRKNWVSAYFLKWIQDGAIYQETREKGLIFKKDAVVFRLNLDKKENMSEAERMLFNMVAAASGSDLVLDENEFKNYSVNHQNKLISFENKVLFESKRRLGEKALLAKSDKGFLILTNLFQMKKEKKICDNIWGF